MIVSSTTAAAVIINEWAVGEGVNNDGGGGNIDSIDGGGGGGNDDDITSFFLSFLKIWNFGSICRWIAWSNLWFSRVFWQKIDIIWTRYYHKSIELDETIPELQPNPSYVEYKSSYG